MSGEETLIGATPPTGRKLVGIREICERATSEKTKKQKGRKEHEVYEQSLWAERNFQKRKIQSPYEFTNIC